MALTKDVFAKKRGRLRNPLNQPTYKNTTLSTNITFQNRNML